MLNGDGHLLAWTWVVPVDGASSPRAASAPPLLEVLESTGFEPSALQEVEPQRVPRVFADERRAWTAMSGSGDDPDTRIELASLDGHPVQLEVVVDGHQVGARPTSGVWGGGLVGPLVVACSIVLAWRNWKLRRADWRGALRLGVFGFAARLVLLFAYPFPGGWRAWLELFVTNLARSLEFGAMVFVCYAALEPFIRRRWPRALVSWSRLLTGELRDPMVGREVLAGAFAFPAFFGVVMALMSALAAFGIGLDETPPSSCRGLEGPLQTLAVVASGAGSAIAASAAVVLILAAFRALVRPAWLANAGWLALCTPLFALKPEFSIPALVFLLTALILLSRVGFLALVVFFFVFLGITRAPITLDPTDWCFPQSLTALAVYAALLVWGYRAATGGRSLFEPARRPARP